MVLIQLLVLLLHRSEAISLIVSFSTLHNKTYETNN